VPRKSLIGDAETEFNVQSVWYQHMQFGEQVLMYLPPKDVPLKYLTGDTEIDFNLESV
jgi:hypothetical protein